MPTMHSASLTVPPHESRPFNTSSNIGSDRHVLYSQPPKRARFSRHFKTASKPMGKLFRFLQRKTNLSFWILVGLVLGILVGKFAPSFAVTIGPLGVVFIRMIQVVVGPLIFSTLVVGIAGHGENLARMGRLALKSVIFFEVATTLALIFGLVAVNVVRPGNGYQLEGLVAPEGNSTKITWVTEMDAIVPTSFFLAMSDHNAVLAVVFCAIMFSVALMMMKNQESKKVMLDFNASLSDAMFAVVELVMNYAPIGIGCSIASTIGLYGLDALGVAGKLVGTLYVTLILFVGLVLVPILLICRFPLREFGHVVAQPFLMAFATASSESALPKVMESLIDWGVPAEISAFVATSGYSFNLCGTTLYLAVAVIFCAQVAGIQKSIGQQVIIMLSLMLTSKGVAAVPRASFIVLSSSLVSFGVPLAPLALILSVDAFMDMARTSVNVLGNMTACAVIAMWEGQFRNEEWQVRKAGQTPETLGMEDVDSDDYDPRRQPSHHVPLHQHSSPLPVHSIALHDNPVNNNNNNYRSDKTSIHSVHSVRSVRSVNSTAAYESVRGPPPPPRPYNYSSGYGETYV